MIELFYFCIMLKTKLLLTLLFSCLFVAGFWGFDTFRVESDERALEMYRDPKKFYKLKESDKKKLQNGDIIMRKGHGSVSDIIDNMYPTGYHLSHCGIVIKNEDSTFVVHTVSSELSQVDGVQTENLDKFVRESVRHSIVVVRGKEDSLIRNRIADATLSFLQKDIKFDHSFDISDTTSFYCTELIYQAYFSVYGKDMFPERLLTDHPNYLGIDALLDTTKFERIIVHQAFDNKHLPK